MANVPSIPPLFCSTPPPIDDFAAEDDDDSECASPMPSPMPDLYDNDSDDDVIDEYGDFAIATVIEKDNEQNNAELPSNFANDFYYASQQLANQSTTKNADNVVSGNQTMCTGRQETTKEIVDSNCNVNAEPEIEPTTSDEAVNEDSSSSLSSLKFNSFSLNSIEQNNSFATATPTSAEECEPPLEQAIEQVPKQMLTNMVSIEDVEDDGSDSEQFSPKKQKQTKQQLFDETADDYFAIHLIDEKIEATNGKANNVLATQKEIAAEEQTIAAQIVQQDFNDFDNDEFDDFDDFASFEAAPIATTNVIENSQLPAAGCETAFVANFAEMPKQQNIHEDEDDDFGDFNEATFTPPTIQTNTTAPNLHEKLKPVLDMMFPSSAHAAQTYASNVTTSIVNSMLLASIDAAKALEYQWPSSEVRHALIKSLGIDSRNILYGDNWNSNMPRFAANLSFDPLKPLKPTANNVNSSDKMPMANGSVINTANTSSKLDVPAVEFDWNSSGLINPLAANKN